MTPSHTPRRSFLTSLGTLAAAPLFARDFGSGAAPVRYPGPDVIALDKAFEKYKIGSAPIERLHTGMYWAEGPAWSGWGNCLMWSDIPNDAQLRWLQDDSRVTTLRKPANHSNGNTFDREGRQISFEHGARRVVRYEPNNTVTVLAEKFDGKPFNAPNDGSVHLDGSVWFTDPGYGSLGNYEEHKRRAVPQGSRLSHRSEWKDRQAHRRHLQAQRPLFLGRLQGGLHLRHRRHALPRGSEKHPGL